MIAAPVHLARLAATAGAALPGPWAVLMTARALPGYVDAIKGIAPAALRSWCAPLGAWIVRPEAEAEAIAVAEAAGYAACDACLAGDCATVARLADTAAREGLGAVRPWPAPVDSAEAHRCAPGVSTPAERPNVGAPPPATCATCGCPAGPPAVAEALAALHLRPSAPPAAVRLMAHLLGKLDPAAAEALADARDRVLAAYLDTGALDGAAAPGPAPATAAAVPVPRRRPSTWRDVAAELVDPPRRRRRDPPVNPQPAGGERP